MIGTPGRVYDMMKRTCLNTKYIRALFLDEAEVLFDGFKNQLYDIFQLLPGGVQICLFSTTFTDEVFELTRKFMIDPVKILFRGYDQALTGMYLPFIF